MIYRPVRERDPEEIVDTVVARLEEERLRRGVAHVALDRRLLVHLAADQEGRRASSRRSKVSLGRLLAARLRPRARPARRDRQGARERPHVRARGRARSACATWSTRTSPKSSCMTTAERVFSRGWTTMKLYFMIGLPTERTRTSRGIAELGRKIVELGRTEFKQLASRSRCSASTHVPKPHTPFQWCGRRRHRRDPSETGVCSAPSVAATASPTSTTTPRPRCSKPSSRAAIADWDGSSSVRGARGAASTVGPSTSTSRSG